jgi:dipeptidyl aminopeptidase/acylaminoacyl peptidase
MKFLRILLIMIMGFVGQSGFSAEGSIQPAENLVVDGVPPIPQALAEKVRRYTESRGAAHLDWHPSRREMLIETRFANSSQVHWVKMPGGARTQVTFFTEPVPDALFEPSQGDYLVLAKDVGGNEFDQLYRFDLSDGSTTLLTDGGRSQNGGVHWNNAKNQMAFESTQRNGTDRDVWLIDPANPTSQKILVENSGGGWSIDDWSPDDKQLCVMEYLSINKSNLYLVDVATGQKKAINDLSAEVSFGAACFAKDGKALWLTCDQGSEFQRLGRWNLVDGSFQPMTQDIPWDVARLRLSPDGKRLAFTVNEAGASRLYLMETDSLQFKAVPGIPMGVIGLGSWTSDSRELAITLNSARSTSDVYSLDATNDQLTRWTESELGGLVASQLSEPEMIRWNSFDGREISGFLYRPPAAFSGKRPVIINIHGGPESQSRPIFLGRSNYFLNELGVAIIYPNVRGSAGFGKTYVKLDNGLKRLDSVKDIGSLLDWIAHEPTLDASRIMVTGGSYGGYMTLASAVEFNDRIRCSLDVVGISHFGTFLKNTESYRRDLRRAEYGDERDPQIAEFFDRTAPLNNASKIKKPLFVVQGGNDPRVPLSEAEQIVAKVKANGTPLWYLMARDEGHGFSKKNNADFQFYATVLFVEEFLLGERH